MAPADEDLVVELAVPPAEADLAAMRLWDAGATAVGLDERPQATVLTASFPTPAATRLVAGEVGGQVVATDPSWRDAWRAYAEPVEIGNRLVVALGWRDVEVGGGRLVLRIDPGGCFGSGTHASTRLVLTLLDRDPPVGLDVLDVGCGSGILAVAGARLGAARVTAVDIESEAVEVTRANAAANGVSALVEATATPVEELGGAFDLALVNVTAGVHAVLGPAVSALVGRGGRLFVAGLLPGQWRHVAGAYPGTTVVERVELDGWEGTVLAR